MADTFPVDDAIALLAECHRRCCICHRFCGVKMELDHMVQKVDGGANTISNAIPLCFECHAEVHAYNNKHPRGRKFQPDELKRHKEQWLAFCKSNPGTLAQMSPDVGVGPLQALIDELDFNIVVAERIHPKELGCPFADAQFRRAIQAGALATLEDTIRGAVYAAYADMGRANHFLAATHAHGIGSNAYNTALNEAQKAAMKVPAAINAAKQLIQGFLGAT